MIGTAVIGDVGGRLKVFQRVREREQQRRVHMI